MNTEEPTYRILIIDTVNAVAGSLSAILEGKGYHLSVFDQLLDGLNALKKDKSGWALVITNFHQGDFKGDQILLKAREISPDTQRMLVAESSDIQALVSAVNKAGIHACLTLPLKNDDLINQVSLCCKNYDENIKLKNLRRITSRQNKQLFKIAANFKKKDDLNVRQLDKKDKEIRILESRIRSAGGSVTADKPVCLDDILKKQEISPTQKNLPAQFSVVKDRVRQIFETALNQHYIDLEPIAYADAKDLKAPSEPIKQLAQKILPLAFEVIQSGKVSVASSQASTMEVVLDDQFELTLSKSKTQAFIRAKTDDAHDLSLVHVKQFLEKYKIINGVKNDDAISLWLKSAYPDDDAFLIAMGKDPKYPKDAEIHYHFPTDYLHAGKINNDGSINFQDRGDIPYVEEQTLLAAKVSAQDGKPGIDVHGREILVDQARDLTFSAGPGTRMSEDGMHIYADTAGQPHLDAMGNVSVCPEYQLKGDIGFETGDVNFDGNVVVSGKVKEGFKVQCASLTAEEIQGAHIDITGDLNVSLGIVDTELVKVKGSVQAKFIRNSKINAFGDLIIQKEIVDSTIYLSGACINETGSIINSQISAKRGIKAGSIGNPSSKASHLTVGVDEHAKLLVAKVDAKLNTNNKACKELMDEIAVLEKEDQQLHAVIASHAHVQDRAQLELKDIEKKMESLKASGNMSAYQKVSKTVQEIRKNAAAAEQKINEGFDRQDQLETEINQKRTRIKEFEDQNKEYQDEKKRILEFSGKKEPLPEVTVARNAESGTRIFSENASLTLHSKTSRCRIREYSQNPDGAIPFYEIKIGEL